MGLFEFLERLYDSLELDELMELEEFINGSL